MMGVEYIISEKTYGSLPATERAYWHPHNYEILSGQLRLPGLPDIAEKEALRGKMNSYGKTWHVWNTGTSGQGGDALPFGAPMLAWSFNRDGEVKPELVEQRDRAMAVSTADKRRRRADLQPLARPQSGVDDLKPAFPQAQAIPGVVDRRATANASATAAPASGPRR